MIEILIITPILLMTVGAVAYFGTEIQAGKYDWLGQQLLGYGDIGIGGNDNGTSGNTDGSNDDSGRQVGSSGGSGGTSNTGGGSNSAGSTDVDGSSSAGTDDGADTNGETDTGTVEPVDVTDDLGCEPDEQAAGTDGDGQSGQNDVALEDDTGFFGRVWNSIKDTLGAALDFVRGFWEGMKKQVSDLAQLVADPVETGRNLIALGQAFLDSPAETLAAIGDSIGKDLSKLVHCGSFDRGSIIGENVSPVFMLKLASRLSHFDGDLLLAVRQTRRDLDIECASFVAGTTVWSNDGMTPIESVVKRQFVHSRDEHDFRSNPQVVGELYNRTADHYHELQIEHDTVSLTAEHPVWLQGKGWTKAEKIKRGDVLASADGDTVVLGNTRIEKSVNVYNFSVTNTPSYFVGAGKLWVHNAGPCLVNWTQQIPGLPNVTLVRINRSELFGTPTSGSGSALRGNLMENYPALRDYTPPDAGWQAHHVIPFGLQHPLLTRLNFDKNSIHNGIPLPTSRNLTSAAHLGRHRGVYDDAIREFLDTVDQMDDATVQMDTVIRGIEELRKALAEGTIDLNKSSTIVKTDFSDLLSRAILN